MSRGRDVSNTTKLAIWGRAAGCCQFRNCRERLDHDLIAGKSSINKAYLAHIVASDPGGPRGHPVLSHQLADDPENIMLMCDAHHRLIDHRAHRLDYPVDLLQEMKREHEAWVDTMMGARFNSRSHILQVSSPIGDNETAVRFDDCVEAIMPKHTPANLRPIEIKIRGMRHIEADPTYYDIELATLRRRYEQEVARQFEDGKILHLSVFALAPIPLLVELGRLISDISQASVYQPHREPRPQWCWADDKGPISFRETAGPAGPKRVALKLSISASITDERVLAVYDDPVSVWEISCDAPHNDIMRTSSDLSEFKTRVRRVLDKILFQHGPDAELSVFPAIPASCAVEFGRVWQPKAHLPMDIFDQSSRDGGFVKRTRVFAA